MKIKNLILCWFAGLGILLIMIALAMFLCEGLGFLVRNFFPFSFWRIGFWGDMANGIAALGIIALAVIIGGFMYIGSKAIGEALFAKNDFPIKINKL